MFFSSVAYFLELRKTRLVKICFFCSILKMYFLTHAMRFNIRVTGAAGLGMNSTADIIADVFAELGYHVNTDIEYQSIIKG